MLLTVLPFLIIQQNCEDTSKDNNAKIWSNLQVAIVYKSLNDITLAAQLEVDLFLSQVFKHYKWGWNLSLRNTTDFIDLQVCFMLIFGHGSQDFGKVRCSHDWLRFADIVE